MTNFPDKPRKIGITFAANGKTQQHHKDDCSIHTIVSKWRQGQAPPMPTRDEIYADFTGVDDYLSAKLRIEYALEAFGHLPAEIRAEFDNEPGELIRFLDNPENREKALEMGLLDESEAPVSPETPETVGEEPQVLEPETGNPPEGVSS